MPILARVGRRSLRMRIAIALVYATLLLGALTMLYPLVLMISGSVRSDTDFAWVTPIPEYLLDDRLQNVLIECRVFRDDHHLQPDQRRRGQRGLRRSQHLHDGRDDRLVHGDHQLADPRDDDHRRGDRRRGRRRDDPPPGDRRPAPG